MSASTHCMLLYPYSPLRWIEHSLKVSGILRVVLMLISRPRLNFTRLIFIHKITLGSLLSSTFISIWYDKLSDSESLRGWKGNAKPVKSMHPCLVKLKSQVN